MTYRPAISLIQGLLAFAGVCDAGFVYVEKTRLGDVPCINGSHDCTTVTMGPYGSLGPGYALGPLHFTGPVLDLSLVGLAAYLVFLFLAIVKGTSDGASLITLVRRVFLALSLFGFCYSWYLQWLAHFVIKAFCVYCFTSAGIMTLLFLLAAHELRLSLRPAQAAEPVQNIDPSI